MINTRRPSSHSSRFSPFSKQISFTSLRSSPFSKQISFTSSRFSQFSKQIPFTPNLLPTMKFTSTLFALSATLLPLTANAYCNFRLKVANSQNHDLDGIYVQSFNNVATLGPPFTNVTLSFAPGSTGPSAINSIGFSNEGTGRLALAPSLGVERLIFVNGDTLPENVSTRFPLSLITY